VGFQTYKEQGEWAELCFMARARQIGLTILKPYGDSSSYDVGIEHEGRLLRVQIKSTGFSRGGKYVFNLVGAQHTAYKPGLVDFYALYIIPVNVGYVIPYEVAAQNTSAAIRLDPSKDGHKYEEYFEGWHLLQR
jgi:hypothetical protein